MIHDTYNPDVLWYIDSIIPFESSYKVTGWIAHKTAKIIGLRINDQNINYTSTDRKDVLLVYPFLIDSKVGIEFTISKNDITKPIDIITTIELLCVIFSPEASVFQGLQVSSSPIKASASQRPISSKRAPWILPTLAIEDLRMGSPIE